MKATAREAILALQEELRLVRESEQSAAVRLRAAEERAATAWRRVDELSERLRALGEKLSAAPRVAMTVNVHGGAVDFNGTAHSGR